MENRFGTFGDNDRAKGELFNERISEPGNELILEHNDHVANTSNPHGVTKSDIGLSNVDDTSDADKPVSTAQQAALNQKLDSANPAAISGIVYAYKNIGGSL